MAQQFGRFVRDDAKPMRETIQVNAVSFFMRAAAVAAFAGPAAMAQGAGLEAGAALPGSQLAPAALLKGPLHKVA